MSATTNLNRIPLNVNHNNNYQTASSNYTSSNTTEQQHFSRDFRSSSSNKLNNNNINQDYPNNHQHQHHQNNNNNNAGIYDMRNINDETDRIKNRMREFEERCKRWREDFFAKTSNTNPNYFNEPFHSQFDQRVPFNNNNNNNTSSSFDGNHNHIKSTPQFGSTMHRSFIEDSQDGSGIKKYRIEFDIGDFKQNELMVSTNVRSLIVKGDRELKAGSSTETKTFNRELTLPEYVDINKMNAFLMDNNFSDPAITSSGSGSLRASQNQLVSNLSVNNVLVVEAPIIMEKYSYRRSAFDKSQSPIRISTTNQSNKAQSPTKQQQPQQTNQYTSKLVHNNTIASPTTKSTTTTTTTSESHHRTENQTSTSHQTISKIIHNGSGYDLNMPISGDDENHSNINFNTTTTNATSPLKNNTYLTSTSQSNLAFNQALAPELISGYPIYDNIEGCVVYKFNLSGFDQSEIHLTITVDRTLEIKACKEQIDHLGKVYREFKREIALEPEVDANLIKNVLHEGILTLKIPKANRPDGLGSLSNNHNLQTPDGFREIYNDEGKLAKLNADFRGYNPENVKIVLSANNILKVTAQQVESSPNSKGTVQKECTRQYTLPAWIQPENMKAIMSRDGTLTIDFSTNNNSNINTNKSNQNADERLNIN